MRFKLNPLASNGLSVIEENTTVIASGGGSSSSGGGVTSVNTRTGDVVINSTDVADAGALMDSELTDIASVKALNQGVATTDSPTFAGASLTGGTSITPLTVSTTPVTNDVTLAFKNLKTTSVPRMIIQNKLANSSGTEYSAFEIRTTNETSTPASEQAFTDIYGYTGGATRRYLQFYSSSIFQYATNWVLTSGTRIYPSTTGSSIGLSSNYFSNTYTDRLYLNSTSYIDGATAGTANLTGNLGILATGGSATHSLTLGSTSTGIALYNTADQTTNYERVRQYWNSNEYNIYSDKGGSGTTRAIRLANANGFIAKLNVGSDSGIFQVTGTTGFNAGIGINLSPAFTASSGTVIATQITPVINTSGTNAYTALLINPTETTTGSGAKLLADFQVGGTSKVKIANTGDVEITDTTKGVILTAPDASRWRITVDNSGNLITSSI